MTGKLYRKAQIEATKPDIELEPEDYEGRALRACKTHRWLDDPDRKYIAQLKGGGSAWPQIVRELQESYGHDAAREPRHMPKPDAVSDHDIIFGLNEGCEPWFSGLSGRHFSLIWYRGALDWSFQRMADVKSHHLHDTKRRYAEAITAVIENACRGEFEV